jgi:oligopeptide transport system substrate-binding protein
MRTARGLQTRLAAGALVAALGLSACASEESNPYFGTTSLAGRDLRAFYVNNVSEPEYLDPGKCNDTLSGALIAQLFEGLTGYDPRDGHPVQGVAESWDRSDDNRLFRFHLRDDARWSDGVKVTARDFEYAWKRVLRPSTASKSVPNLYALKNGEPFSQGKLKALRRDVMLRSAALASAPAQGSLAKGTFVLVVAAEKGWAQVERWSSLPTYSVRPLPAPPRSSSSPTALGGFVAEEDLIEDDAVLGVRATDDRTLEVELERPTPYFLRLTSYHTLFPVRRDVVEAFERRGDPDLWTRPGSLVSNGPYVLDRWVFRYEISMRKNPEFRFADRIKIDRIVWLEVEDAHATMNLYKTGEIDYLGENMLPPAEYLQRLSLKKDFRRNDFLAVQWYELNTRKPPLDDARVRRALNLAIDKQTLVDRVQRGGEMAATHYVPDFTGLGYSAQVKAERLAGIDPFSSPSLEFDPEKARALLREAGYPVEREGESYRVSGFPPLEVVYNNNEGHQKAAVAIQDMWKRNLGVSILLRSEEWKVMLNRYREGQFQVIRLGWTADYDHPQTFLEQFLSENPQNQSGWGDPRFDAAMKQAAATAETEESIRLYRKAESIALEAMPRLPLFFETRSTLVKPWVKGFWGSSLNPHLVQYLWIDPDWQRGLPNEPAYLPAELPLPGRIAADP